MKAVNNITMRLVADTRDAINTLIAIRTPDCSGWLGKIGSAVVYGKKYLEHDFKSFEDGSLEEGADRTLQKPAECVEIELFDGNNIVSLAELDFIKYCIERKIETQEHKERIKSFCVHGHVNGSKVENIRLDSDGKFYLSSERQKFESNKIPKVPGQRICTV